MNSGLPRWGGHPKLSKQTYRKTESNRQSNVKCRKTTQVPQESTTCPTCEVQVYRCDKEKPRPKYVKGPE